jgi:hypothetical protein
MPWAAIGRTFGAERWLLESERNIALAECCACQPIFQI